MPALGDEGGACRVDREAAAEPDCAGILLDNAIDADRVKGTAKVRGLPALSQEGGGTSTAKGDAHRGVAGPRKHSHSIIVLEPEMGNQFRTAQIAQGVLQLHELDKQVMLWIEPRSSLGALKIE